MSDRKDREFVREAIDQGFSSLQGDSFLFSKLKSREEEKQQKTLRKWPVGLALAIVLLLAGVTALALNHSYVLMYLFGKNVDSQKAQQMEEKVQRVNYVQRSNTAICCVKDAIFDGTSFSVGFSFDTQRPLYLVMESLNINGEPIEWFQYIEFGNNIEEMWVGHSPPGQPKKSGEAIHGLSYTFARELPVGEEIEVSMRITLMAPKQGVEMVDTYQEDHAAMWRQIDEIYARGDTPLSVDEPFEACISSGWFSNFYPEMTFQKPLCDVEALEAYANMEVVDVFEADFTLVKK